MDKKPDTEEPITLRILATKKRIIEGLSKCGGNISRACQFAGITPPTYYSYLNDEAFKVEAYAATRHAKETRLDEIQDSLYKQATCEDRPSVIAGIFLAKCLGRSSDDPSRQFNDTARPDTITDDTSKNVASLSDTNQQSIKLLLSKYVQSLESTTVNDKETNTSDSPTKDTTE